MAVCCVLFLMLPTWVPALSKVSTSSRLFKILTHRCVQYKEKLKNVVGIWLGITWRGVRGSGVQLCCFPALTRTVTCFK